MFRSTLLFAVLMTLCLMLTTPAKSYADSCAWDEAMNWFTCESETEAYGIRTQQVDKISLYEVVAPMTLRQWFVSEYKPFMLGMEATAPYSKEMYVEINCKEKSYKILDKTLRGNWGPETNELKDLVKKEIGESHFFRPDTPLQSSCNDWIRQAENAPDTTPSTKSRRVSKR